MAGLDESVFLIAVVVVKATFNPELLDMKSNLCITITIGTQK